MLKATERRPVRLRLFIPFILVIVSRSFDSLFKVLFNFPSRYLFAIGLVVVFSFRWSLPPALGCTFKQPDSREESETMSKRRISSGRVLHPLWTAEMISLFLYARRWNDQDSSHTRHRNSSSFLLGIDCCAYALSSSRFGRTY